MFTKPAQKVYFLSSLRTSSLLASSWIASTSTWWRSLSSCFLANFPIQFVTISIRRSVWRSAFLIYQDASKMFLKYVVLKSLYDVSVALSSASPQLYAVGPHRLQYLFVERQLSVYRQGRSSSHDPIHFFFLYFSPSSFFYCYLPECCNLS